MKRLYSLPFLAIGWFLFGSCDDRGQNFDHSDIVGSYRMTQWNAPVPVDFDHDGDSSRNLMDESTCYDQSWLAINDDRTFLKTYKTVAIDNGEVSCHTQNISGTWTRQGHVLNFTWETDGGTMSDLYYFGEVNRILTRTMEDADYPTIANGVPTYAAGPVTVVFEKDTD